MSGYTDRTLLVAIGPDGQPIPVKVDSFGNLTVAGAGVTSGTQVQLVDGTTTSQKAVVDTSGRLHIIVEGTVELAPATLAALETINIGSMPAVALDTATLAALETISVTNMIPAVETGLSKEVTLAALRTDFNAEDFATQATLELVRAQVAAINANTDTLEALLTTIRDEQLRRTDPLATGSSIIGFTSPSTSKKVSEGKFFIAGQSIALGGIVSTERATFRVENPVASGKVVYIVGITIYSSVAQQVQYWRNSTLTDTVITPQNINFASAAVSVVRASFGTGTTAGGTQMPNESRVAGTAPLNLAFPPLVLPPGQALVIRGTIGDSQVFTANCYYYEE